jgi:hypothetical protein
MDWEVADYITDDITPADDGTRLAAVSNPEEISSCSPAWLLALGLKVRQGTGVQYDA